MASLHRNVGLPAKRQREVDEQSDEPGTKRGGDGEAIKGQEEEFARLDAVSRVQEELNVLEEEEAQQVLLVHKTFLKRKRPLYARRQDAISKVPDFWLKVLLAHPATQPWIADSDQLALSYLEAVDVHKASGDTSGGSGKDDAAEQLDDDDDVGFRVTFTFRENPFFANTKLWKEWQSDPDQIQGATSGVKWKETEEGRELRSCVSWKAERDAEGAGEEDDAEALSSFFSLFDDGDVDDYELAEALRGEITENPLNIYMMHDFDAEAEDAEDPDEEFVGDNLEGTPDHSGESSTQDP